jgi:DnaJ-domain-containing protein 1
MHHPDMHSNGSEAEKARAVERSKLITNAYKTIKSQMKK